ncbi:MAG: hypothetical protein COB65_11365 [Thalassobium sp.]|nr:MAG: hypothetical protein COB65_11365 [Thalassobium sp.]
MEILKQNEGSPMRVEEQIAIIYCGTKGLLMGVPVKKIKEFEAEFVEFMNAKHADVMSALASGKYTDAQTSVLESVCADLSGKY